MENKTNIEKSLEFYLDVLSKAPGQEVEPEGPAVGEVWKDQDGVTRYFNGAEWIELK